MTFPFFFLDPYLEDRIVEEVGRVGSFPFEADDEVFSSPLLLSTLIYITPLLELLSRSTIYFETNVAI